MRSPRREAASARKKRHQELAAERRQHKERAAEARKATAGGGAGALVAKFRRRVATFDKNRDFEHLDDAARGILLAAEASAAAARALSEARAPEALAAALTVAPAATGQLGWACDAVSRRLPTVVAIRAVAENENAATMSEHWLNACARALAVHSADDGVCGSTMARAIASSARQNLDDLEFPFLVIPSLHVLDRLYNGVGARRPSINCGRRASLLQLGMAQPAGPPRLRTTDDRLAFQIAAALDRLDDDDVATHAFASLVAAVTRHVPRTTADDAQLKLIRALAAAPNDDDENDPLASDACATEIIRLALAGRRTACDALAYLLQNGGTRTAAARRALRRAGGDSPARWLQAAASQVGRTARSCLRVAGALVAMKGSASLTTSQAKRRTGDVEECLGAAQLALQTASSLMASPQNVAAALNVFASAADAACRAARDRGLALARAFEDDYVQDRTPGSIGERAAALALATLSEPEAAADALEAALSLGGGDAQACYEALRPRKASEAIASVVDNAAAILDQRRIQSDDGDSSPRLDFADEAAQAAAAQAHAWCRLAAALHSHEARARPADPLLREALRPAVCAARASLSAATQLDLDALDRAVAFVAAATGVDNDSSSDGVVDSATGRGGSGRAEDFRPEGSERAPASNSAREEEEAYAAAAYDEDRNGQTDTMALRRSLEGSQVALRRLAADLGSTNTTVAPAPPPPPPQDALRRARAPDIIAVDDAVPAARDDVAFDVAPADPRSPRPDRSPAFAASIKRPAFFADEEAFRPGGPVQHTPPRSPIQREVFADDYDEAETVETDDRNGQDDPEQDDDVCAACGQPPTMRCPCLTASYCSRECQRAHWRTHKRACPLRRSRASLRTASEVSVAAEPVVAAQSTQNGDRRSAVEGEAYAASTAATYDGSTASGADADTDEWSRSRAYSAASAPSTAAVYDGSAASGAGEETDDGSRDGPTRDRGESPTRDDVTAARLAAARQAQAPADGSTPPAESPQEKFVRVWSAADEAAAAEVFDLTTPHEARDFDAAVDDGIEDVRRDLRGSIRLAPSTPVDDAAGSPAASRAAGDRIREAFESRSREAPVRTSAEEDQSREAAVRVREAYTARSRDEPVLMDAGNCEEPVLTDAALDALLPAEGFATLDPPRRSSGVFADEFPMVADATAAVSSFLFGGTPPREGRADLRHDERRAEAAPTPVVDADDWHQAVDDAGVPYFVSAATGETARAAPVAWLRAAREEPGEDGARIRSRGDWVEALDASSGRVYYANSAGSVQWTRPAVFDDDDEEEDAPQWVSAARRSDEFDNGDDDARRRASRRSSTELEYRGPARSTPSAAARLFPGAGASSPPSATRDVGVGGASASVQSVGSGGASASVQSVGSGVASAAVQSVGSGGASASVQSVGSGGASASVQSVGSGVAAATTASVSTEASPAARDVGVGGASAAVQSVGSGAAVVVQSVGSGNASAAVHSVGSGGASAQTASVGVGRAAPAVASVGVGRRAFAEVSSGSDDDDDAAAPAPPPRVATATSTGPPPPRTPPPARATASAGNSTPRAWGRADAWVGDSDSGDDDGLEALLRGHEAGRGTVPPPAASDPPSRSSFAAATDDDQEDISVHAWRSVSSGGSSRPSAGSPRAPARDQLSAPKKSPDHRRGSADLQARLSKLPGSPASPDRKQGSADLQARLRKLPGSPAGRPAHKRGSANLQARLRKLQAAAHKVGARPAAARSPTRPSPRAVEEADAAYVSPRFLRRGDGRRCVLSESEAFLVPP
jgi:hypothetical protein